MKHLSISKWLRQLGLPQYCTLFDEEYDGVEVRCSKLHVHTFIYTSCAIFMRTILWQTANSMLTHLNLADRTQAQPDLGHFALRFPVAVKTLTAYSWFTFGPKYTCHCNLQWI